MIVRGRPRFLDPQLDRGYLRFALRRGASFTALLPDNKFKLSLSAYKASQRVVLQSRPSWFQLNCLIRVGSSESVGELHIIQDLIADSEIETRDPLLQNYIVDEDSDVPNFVTLLGTPATFFAVALPPFERKSLIIESWYRIFPGDAIYCSPTPQVYDSLAEFEIKRADAIGTRPGTGVEPTTIYRYEVEVATKSGLLPFAPTVDLPLYLKAQPIFARGDFGDGDIKIPNNIGPCLLDAYYGDLLINEKVETRLGIKTWDAFGNQLNSALTGNQEWQPIPENYLLLERPIRSDTFLFWQRIKGKFQYQKSGFFQAELDDSGEFIMSSDILVPHFPVDRQHGWVIPIIPQGAARVTVQFEPQATQVFDIPGNQLSFVRPKLLVDPNRKGVFRIVFAIKGAPNARVEIRDWNYDGSTVQSVSYFMLGAKAAFGDNRWLSGGFCAKPLFFNLDVLKGHYSDGSTKYNSGYVYV